MRGMEKLYQHNYSRGERRKTPQEWGGRSEGLRPSSLADAHC